MKIEIASEKDFESHIAQASSPIIVSFGADWCAPCKALDPHFEALANKWQDKVNVMVIDVDAFQDLSERYEVISIPLFLLFKSGQLLTRHAGIASLSALEQLFIEAAN